MRYEIGPAGNHEDSTCRKSGVTTVAHSKTCLLLGCSEETGYVIFLSLRCKEQIPVSSDVRRKVLVLLGVFSTIHLNIVTIHIIYVSLNVMWVLASYRISCLERKWRAPQMFSIRRLWLPQNIWLKSRLLNLTGTFKRSHSEVLCDAVSVPSVQLSYFTKDKRDTQMVTAEHSGEEQFHK